VECFTSVEIVHCVCEGEHGPGLWLDWIQTIGNFVEFGLDPECKSLQNLGSETCGARLCSHTFSVGIDPRTSGRLDCDVIDVNSAPDGSAKESSHFHVHGSHLLGLSLLLALAVFAHM